MAPTIVTVALAVSAVLGALTNRWLTESGTSAGFNIVSFRSLYFQCQWAGFLISLAIVTICLLEWRTSGRVSWRLPAAIALVVFYVAGGVLTKDANRWASGQSSPSGWLKAREEKAARETLRAPLVGRWQGAKGVWTISQETLIAPGCNAVPGNEIGFDSSDRVLTAEVRAKLGAKLPQVPSKVLVMQISCVDQFLTAILIDDDHLVAVPWPSGDPEVLNRIRASAAR